MNFRVFGELQVRPVENRLEEKVLRSNAILKYVLKAFEVNLGIEFRKRVRRKRWRGAEKILDPLT
jgi:hypothetical protein